jgi:FixJ family two-component response regulator
MKGGAIGFLGKPFDDKVLLESVSSALAERIRTAQPSPTSTSMRA